MAVNKISRTKQEKVRTSVYLEKDLVDKFEAVNAHKDRSFSYLVNDLLRKDLGLK